jgi:hypothetical protein
MGQPEQQPAAMRLRRGRTVSHGDHRRSKHTPTKPLRTANLVRYAAVQSLVPLRSTQLRTKSTGEKRGIAPQPPVPPPPCATAAPRAPPPAWRHRRPARSPRAGIAGFWRPLAHGPCTGSPVRGSRAPRTPPTARRESSPPCRPSPGSEPATGSPHPPERVLWQMTGYRAISRTQKACEQRTTCRRPPTCSALETQSDALRTPNTQMTADWSSATLEQPSHS